MICLLRVTTHAKKLQRWDQTCIFSALAETKAKGDCSTCRWSKMIPLNSWHLKENTFDAKKKIFDISKHFQMGFLFLESFWGNPKINLSRFWRFRMCHRSISAFCLIFLGSGDVDSEQHVFLALNDECCIACCQMFNRLSIFRTVWFVRVVDASFWSFFIYSTPWFHGKPMKCQVIWKEGRLKNGFERPVGDA